MFELGTVSRWIDKFSYGFIKMDETNEMVFVHKSGIADGGGVLPVGARVRFQVAPDDQDRRRVKAVDVFVVG